MRSFLALTVTAAVAAGLALAVPAAAAPSTSLVVSEAYGGGGNSGATLKNDFAELANLGPGNAALGGYSVQYLPASASASSTWGVTPLSGTVPAGGHFLVGEAAGQGGTDALPAPDATGSLNFSGTGGTVALVHSTTALTCKSAADCAADPTVVDLVGWGGAVVHEGSAAAGATTNSTSIQRTAGDTDQNGTDFTVAAPTPTNSGTAAPPTRIHDIQGGAFLSPKKGAAVTDVPGVVTALDASRFWLQDPQPDDDPATSEGIVVYTASAPTVAVGDSVLVSGTVQEFYASGTTDSLAVTEITTPAVQLVSSGNALPEPVILGPDVPDGYAPDLGNGNIEAGPIMPTRSALDYYESLEGMRVQVNDARVVGPSNDFGEQYVTTKPTTDATYRGGVILSAPNRIPTGRLEVVALDGSDPGVDVGDVFQGATVGPLDWSKFGGYVLEANQLGTVVHHHLAPVRSAPGKAAELSIATYNVENLAPSDPQTKFDALAQGVVTNLGRPDIVALEEIQDNTGAADDGTVAADATLTELTAAISAKGGPSYQWREIDPVNDRDGGQPGGNIRVAFLFNPARVSFHDRGASTVNRSTTGTGVAISDHRAALTLSPGRIDPANPVWNDSRKPLAAEFAFRGQRVIVIANHFDSKGGDQSADGRFQYPEESSQVQRAGQAQVVHRFVEQIQAKQRDAKVVVLGDLNDYQFSSPLTVLRTGTADGTGRPILRDLITALPVDQRYTYVFNGVSQVLDHILTTASIGSFRYRVVHVNAEYAAQVSDHDPQVVLFTP